MHILWIAALATLILNLPFGFYRAGLKKFSLPWFLAVHAPVPLVIGIRVFAGFGWHPSSFFVLVSAFFAGQFLGGKLRSLGSGGTKADCKRDN